MKKGSRWTGPKLGNTIRPKGKYAEAIRRLKESGLPTDQVAAEFGLHPETFPFCLKEHEPELCGQAGNGQVG